MVTEMLDASFQGKEEFRIRHGTLYHIGLSQRRVGLLTRAQKLDAIKIWELISVPNQDRGYLQKFNWDLKNLLYALRRTFSAA